MPASHSQNLQSVTILLIFLFIVIQQIFLISLSVVLLKKIKSILKPASRKYYIFVILYIVTKLTMAIYLQVRILLGIQEQFHNIDSTVVEQIFDNSIALADCFVVELFLVAFEHYMRVSFSVCGSRRGVRNIGYIMKGVQLVAFVSLVVPLVLFNMGIFKYPTLNIFIMSANCLSVVVFIAAFFYMNFKMTGLMIDEQSSSFIKRLYAVSLLLLFSRIIMSVLEVWVQINLATGSFEDFISIIEEKQNQFVVLGFCFVGELVLMLLSEGLPLIISVREGTVAALNSAYTQRNRSSLLEESMLTDSEDTREQILSSTGFEAADLEPSRKTVSFRSSKQIPENYHGVSKIEEPGELEIVERVGMANASYVAYRAKWSKNNRPYFVRKLTNISSFITEEIFNEVESYTALEVKSINPMKIIKKNEDESIFIIEKYLPCNLEQKMDALAGENLRERLALATKIARSIKQFHDCLKTGHGSLNPRNILFDEESRCFVTGFGMEGLRKYLSITTDYCNMSVYTAVELLGSARQNTISKPGKPADVYSFAILLYELATGNSKYRSLSLGEIRDKFVRENTRPKIPDALNEEVKKVMRKCWQEKPENRPEMGWVIATLEAIKP